jgi:isoleucyl-tRNA synthetase
VHLATFPEAAELMGSLSSEQRERLRNWDKLIIVREEVLKALESARRDKFIGTALEARVDISAAGEWANLLQEYKALLPTLFIVSQVTLSNSASSGAESAIGGLRISVQRAEGAKCERCWNYSVRIGEDAAFPTLCERCTPVVRALSNGHGGSSIH